MNTKIDCDKALVKKIFEGWYSIPSYQRPYVWETDQVEELLDCVKNACENKEEQYFLGSIVYVKKSEEKDGVSYTEFELLDGQQRITTIFLIIAVIRDFVFENESKFEKEDFENIKSTCEELIYQKPNKYKSIPERLRIVFNIRKEVRDFVDVYIKSIGSTLEEDIFVAKSKDRNINTSIRHIANTVLIVRKFLKENFTIVGEFLQYLLNNVLLVYIATENLQDAFQLFTVMNNTGLKLANSDILKAENLKEISAKEEADEYASDWEEMESYFGEDFDNFLSQIRTILVKRKADYSLIKEFNDNVYSTEKWNKATKRKEPCKPLLKRGEDTFAFLKDYFTVYQNLFDKNHFIETNSYQISNYLVFMSNGFETDYWKAPVLMYFKKFKYDNFLNFLKKLDAKLSSDWIIGLVPSMRIDNMNKILMCIDKSKTTVEIFQSDVFSLNKNDFHNIISENIYGRKYARYLLLKIDLLMTDIDKQSISPSIISIEHILPQTPNDNSQWKKDFSDAEREEWTDKIGNLALISRRKNSSQGRLDYTEKCKKYFEKNIGTFPSMIKVFQENKEWKLDNLKKRQQEIISLLEKSL
ncbi:DUF262 domain-containing protein [Treponema sp.]|uniref:DUF262 domain-containing protein n=1 Tax=Treponema sp. TaxID=166 RepID=UPI0038911053